MERTNLNYSIKNIPIASERNYKMRLIEKIEAVIKRMRWKAIFFSEEDHTEEEDDEQQDHETFGFKTFNTPKQVPEPIEFENELIEIVKNIKFKKGISNFQLKLKNDLKSINESSKLYVPADKTTNMYKMNRTTIKY